VNTKTRLLRDEDPLPCGVERPESASPILFVSDHAGRAVPQALGTLGLDEVELSRHIGHDIGIYGVTTKLAQTLGATYLFQRYSRLVIDCNRKPRNQQSIPTVSDGTAIPGNLDLTEDETAAREDEIMRPYHTRIETELAGRAAKGRPTVLISMHSYTEQMRSAPSHRPWEICVMAARDWRLADALVQVLQSETTLCVGVNEPYVVDMEMDYTVPTHAEGKNIPYVEIEIRQDLIADTSGQQYWATLLSDIFPRAVAQSGIVPEYNQ